MSAGAWPTISLVTCSYQQGRFLDSTIRSVLSQAYPALEYLVIDGGSRDESVGIIERHAPSLAYWVSEPDGGQTNALIKGFSRATGDIHGWLCSDDLLLPGALARVGAYFRDHPDVQAVYGDALWIDEAGDFIRPKREHGFNRFVFLFDHNFVPQPAMFWRAGLYTKVGGLDARFNLGMDSDLWERFSRVTRIAHIPHYLACMRYYPEQKTRSLSTHGRREDQVIRARTAPPLAVHPLAFPVLHRTARALRIASKLLAGGYNGKPSAEQLQWLDGLRVAPAGRTPAAR